MARKQQTLQEVETEFFQLKSECNFVNNTNNEISLRIEKLLKQKNRLENQLAQRQNTLEEYKITADIGLQNNEVFEKKFYELEQKLSEATSKYDIQTSQYNMLKNSCQQNEWYLAEISKKMFEVKEKLRKNGTVKNDFHSKIEEIQTALQNFNKKLENSSIETVMETFEESLKVLESQSIHKKSDCIRKAQERKLQNECIKNEAMEEVLKSFIVQNEKLLKHTCLQSIVIGKHKQETNQKILKKIAANIEAMKVASANLRNVQNKNIELFREFNREFVKKKNGNNSLVC